jgi:putative tricarboxylic transport membrane protein
MVPLVALGIPGSAPAAVILGALLLQGIQPGPQFFVSEPVVVYSFAWAIILSGVVTFLVGAFLAGSLARMVLIPVRFLAPIVMFLSVVGSFAIRNNIVDVFFMLVLGLGVYFLWKAGFHPGPIGLGIILGPIVEPALVEGLALAQASSVAETFLGSIVSKALIALTAISVLWILWSHRRDQRHAG